MFCLLLAAFSIGPLFEDTAYGTFVALYATITLVVFFLISVAFAFLKLKTEFITRMMNSTYTTAIEAVIAAYGAVIAWACGSHMYKFWLFMLILLLVSVLFRAKKNKT